MGSYDKYMKICFKLAKKAIGLTSPNPLVGCVVLDKNDKLISTGYHKKYGENHAERDALLKLKGGIEKGGTLIVNLEPCNHYGKTPPCTDLIIERGIKRVVIANVDPNPIASGGIEKLKSAGIEIIQGILEEEGFELNEVFFTNIAKKRPFIALKSASTIDGKIAAKTGDSKWITAAKSRNYARKLRKKYDAILTSSTTVIADNPVMEHKTKIIIDRYLKCDLTAQIFKTGKIYFFTQSVPPKAHNLSNIEFIQNNHITLEFILSELYKRKIMSVFVEAGGKLLGTFIKSGYVDKLYQFIAPKILNDNLGKSSFDGDNADYISQAIQFKLQKIKRLEDDLLLIYMPL